MSEYYLIAKVISPFGSGGYVNIFLFTDFPDHLFSLKKVYIDFFSEKKEFRIEQVKCSDDKYIMKFENFNDEKSVELFSGKEIFIAEEDLVKLPEDQFFIHDIIGSKVLRNNVEIGLVTDVLSFPANDVYVIKDKKSNEILIPAVRDYIESFNPTEKIMLLKPGEDLYDTDED